MLNENTGKEALEASLEKVKERKSKSLQKASFPMTNIYVGEEEQRHDNWNYKSRMFLVV